MGENPETMIPLPQTVDETVDHIIDTMSIDEVQKMSSLSEDKLVLLKSFMRTYVENCLRESGITENLRASCSEIAGEELSKVEASSVIVDELWKKVKGLEVME